ncbi:hypothetical protein EON83_21660 [bacterium]|nr:MAG: hypothetical protein EON83_21660 [bacterium]
MENNLWKRVVVATVLGLGATGTVLPTLQPAAAQRAFRSDLIGSWQSNLDDHYTIRSNGTYTFTTGDRLTGNVSHSGTWSLLDGGHTLRLHATRRVVLEGRSSRTLRADKTFRIELENPDFNTIRLDGARFYRP